VGGYILRRVSWSVAVLAGAASLAFVLAFAVPSDPARTIAGEKASPEVLARIRGDLGLDDPLFFVTLRRGRADESLPAARLPRWNGLVENQYGRFLWNLARGDLGRSYRTRERVAEAIAKRLPATAALAAGGMLVQLALGIAVGFVSAVRRGSLVDRVGGHATLALASIPAFWLSLVLLYLLAFRLALFPLGGYSGPWSLVLPSLALGLGGTALYARLLRGEVVAIVREDYVRTAHAKGLAPRVVLARHVLRGALAPIVTLAGLDLGAFLGGVVVVERVFNWPGLGSLAVQAVRGVDTPLVIGTVLFSAAAVVLANLAVDLAYRVLDPRLRHP
jgi:ABC-type dipeptide/oligopeptide/nickel transport system permease component